MLDESISRARVAQDPVREAAGLYTRGRARQIIGDPAGGRADIERALELQTEAGEDAPTLRSVASTDRPGYITC